jgi:predicted transcriptional regulator of viral defense system
LTRSAFTRAEFAQALANEGPERAPATLSSHLTRWQRQGRIQRVKRGLYLRTDPDDEAVDFLTLAARMSPDAALAFHTALECHGLAQSYFETLYFVTWTKAKPLEFRGRHFIPVRPSAALRNREPTETWTEEMERRQLTVRVTTVERTLADVMDRPDLSGGLEEVWRSCSSIQGLDLRELESYVRAVGSRVLAAKVGLFLDRHRDVLAVSQAQLERLRALGPEVPVYMERGRPGKVVREWNLVAPAELLAGAWDSAA